MKLTHLPRLLSLLLLPLLGMASAHAQPAIVGTWTDQGPWPLAASHAALLPDGQVLLWNDHGDAPKIWDPVSKGFSDAQFPGAPLAGTRGVQLGSGDLAVVGGRDSLGIGSDTAWLFTPGGPTWTALPTLQQPRDEPGALLMRDARIFVLGGDRQPGLPADLVERALPGDPWSTVLSAPLALSHHPWAFALPNGQILVAGADGTTRLLDEVQQLWSVVDNMLLGGRPAGSAVLVPGFPERILIAGGRDPATPTCELLDLQSGAGWTATGALTTPRRHHQLTLLADGKVLATGGTMLGDEASFSVLASEVYDPTAGTWTTWEAMSASRRQYSVALLLPDATVLVAGGGDGSPGSELHADASIFSPPYLFQGPRPTITTAPDSIRYKSLFTMQTPDAGDVASIWFVRTGAVTAGFNSDQRAVPLAFTSVSGALTISAPDSSGIAPPGMYMMFLVDDSGVPSVASLIRMQDGPPVVPLPDITTSPPLTAQVGVNYVYQAQASGGAPITWSLTQAPSWMGINQFNGIVTGVPDSEGDFAIVLRATNVEGHDDQAWSIQVDPGITLPETVVPLGATWRYFKGSTDPGADWAQINYDDTSWAQGISGFGMGDGDDATELLDMRNNYTTVFTRIEFPLASVASLSRLSVLFDYDDGFVVYLNGTRIVSRNAPTLIDHESTADPSHEATGTFEREDFTDAPTLELLNAGTNVLAAVGLNRKASSSDLTLKIELEIAGGGAIGVDVNEAAAATRLPVQIRPNPFLAGTGVSFALRQPGTAQLEIFDVYGRRVHVQHRYLSVGAHALQWDGRDLQGRTTAAGVYVYRLQAPHVDVVGKMTRLSPRR